MERLTMMAEFGCRRGLFLASDALMPFDPLAVLPALEEAGVTQLYPGFEGWFLSNVIPGIRSGERRVITSVIDSMLAGVTICKRTDVERKLCTLWVSQQARGRGIAAELAANAFAWLGTTEPLFTVPEERLAEFNGLLRSWSFSKPVPYPALYRPDRVEYVFNGRIDGMTH